MTKIKLDTSDPDTRATWESAQRARLEVATWPDWKRGRPARVTGHEWSSAHRIGLEGCPHPDILYLGEDNPQSSDPRCALWPHKKGVAGERLMQILGTSRATHLGMWRTNLCNPKWNPIRARDRAEKLLYDADAPWKVIVALGVKVSHMFDRILGVNMKPFAFQDTEHGKTVVHLPHPSGLNRAWNDRESWSQARRLMRTLRPEYAWGDPEDV